MRNLIIVTVILFYFAAGADDKDAVIKIKEEVNVGDIIVVPVGEWVIPRFSSSADYATVTKKTESSLKLNLIRQTASSATHLYMIKELSFEEFQTKKYKKFDIDESTPTLEEIKDQLKLNKNRKYGYEVEVCIDEGEYSNAVIKNVNKLDDGIKIITDEKSELSKDDYTWEYMVTVYKMRKKVDKTVTTEKNVDVSTSIEEEEKVDVSTSIEEEEKVEVESPIKSNTTGTGTKDSKEVEIDLSKEIKAGSFYQTHPYMFAAAIFMMIIGGIIFFTQRDDTEEINNSNDHDDFEI